MPPKSDKCSADDFEKKYGKLVREKYAEYGTAFKLDKALRAHKPAICMTQGLLKQWFLKYGGAATGGNAASSSGQAVSAAIRITSRAELQQKFGDVLQSMADEHPTAYRLRAALVKMSPSVLVSDGVAKEWFKHHRSELKYIGKAGDLEVHCGGRIREAGAHAKDAEGLRTWLREQHKVDVSVVVCKTWLRKDWSSDGSLRSVYDIEEQIGDLLRMQRYAESFSSDASADVLAAQLIEGQPPVYTTGALLRQWYTKFHHGAGAKRIATVAELEAFMGDDLRGKYHGIPRTILATVLARRRCPVLITDRVARDWLEQYGIPVLKRPAQSVSVPCKRPAASVSANSASSAKRRRTDVSEGSAEGPCVLSRPCSNWSMPAATGIDASIQILGSACKPKAICPKSWPLGGILSKPLYVGAGWDSIG